MNTVQNDIHAQNKALIRPLRQALYNYDPSGIQAALSKTFHLAYPFETLAG